MKNIEIAKNQHYVPQFLLKNFTVGKKSQLWVFDKKTGDTHFFGPVSLGSKPDYEYNVQHHLDTKVDSQSLFSF